MWSHRVFYNNIFVITDNMHDCTVLYNYTSQGGAQYGAYRLERPVQGTTEVDCMRFKLRLVDKPLFSSTIFTSLRLAEMRFKIRSVVTCVVVSWMVVTVVYLASLFLEEEPEVVRERGRGGRREEERKRGVQSVLRRRSTACMCSHVRTFCFDSGTRVQL